MGSASVHVWRFSILRAYSTFVQSDNVIGRIFRVLFNSGGHNEPPYHTPASISFHVYTKISVLLRGRTVVRNQYNQISLTFVMMPAALRVFKDAP